MTKTQSHDNDRPQFYLTDDPEPKPSGETVILCGPSSNLRDILKFADQLESEGKMRLWLCDEYMCMKLGAWSVEGRRNLLDTFNHLNEEMYLDLLGLCERTIPNWFSE